ncbi:hypothetical protein [Ruixingdingia sedimenti]|uniref:ZZ-type domain-containing protein n=1 Tax=Ruixingdingia sedimenti TaxID=3073604 RepID=A0ABU1FAI1_9RHOB|nr:hypothetical protein [Xinfangfangia sp. LG-4]MDR5653910.1 hypothetical protein [Xinfangfangia sp. LG-4]
MADRDGYKFMQTCFTCGSGYQFGPGRYDGKHIARYGIDVCRSCYEGNWDGWAPHYGEKIIVHLNMKDLPIPAVNASGFLPRD